MNESGRFYERVLKGLHKFEFVAYISKMVAEEHPGGVAALTAAWAYFLKLIVGNPVVAVVLTIPLVSAFVLWKRRTLSRRPSPRGGRRGGSRRRVRKARAEAPRLVRRSSKRRSKSPESRNGADP
jgi:hypothetical protein